MPWKEKTVMEQRKEFIEQAAECTNFSALCREYGISRKTGYKWLNRFREDGSVSDRSRRPKHPHAKTAPVIEAAVLAMREENPSWGGRTIHAVLEADGIKGLPSAKTCSNILKRNGCIKPEESLKHRAYQRFEREQCNSLWQTDFKGDFGLLDGSRCYPLDILDDHSRFCIRTEPKNSATGVKESFIQAFQEYGLPDAILSDHGSQFAGFKGGYTHFERWLMDLDILPIHGRIMHPQTQGKIERFHRTMKAELLREPFLDLKDAKKHFARWRWKAYYETIAVNGFPCLIVREHPKPSERAILYFFGGGMVIGPDKGDLPVMRKLCRETGCDVWFPFYPLCMEHCITETYAMVYECYRKMITLYGGGNVSTCGFSSGGALALGIAAHNNAQPEPLPQPRHIVVVSPGEVPWNDAEKARMQALNKRDVSIDYAFMVTVEKIMRHGCENVPDYMLSGSRGDFTGVGDIHFFYSADEVLYGALPDFEEACKRANVPYTVSARPKMVHCYCMLPIFKEAKEDFAKIVDILRK